MSIYNHALLSSYYIGQLRKNVQHLEFQMLKNVHYLRLIFDFFFSTLPMHMDALNNQGGHSSTTRSRHVDLLISNTSRIQKLVAPKHMLTTSLFHQYTSVFFSLSNPSIKSMCGLLFLKGLHRSELTGDLFIFNPPIDLKSLFSFFLNCAWYVGVCTMCYV